MRSGIFETMQVVGSKATGVSPCHRVGFASIVHVLIYDLEASALRAGKKGARQEGAAPASVKNKIREQRIKLHSGAFKQKMQEESTLFFAPDHRSFRRSSGAGRRMLQAVQSKQSQIYQLLHVPRMRKAPPARSPHAASWCSIHLISILFTSLIAPGSGRILTQSNE